MAYVNLLVDKGSKLYHIAYLKVPEKYIESAKKIKINSTKHFIDITLNREDREYFKGKVKGWNPNFINYLLEIVDNITLEKLRSKSFKQILVV